ncbi:MAG: MptD family putative ECF transporter S component [Lachnospiraceae bacterium]
MDKKKIGVKDLINTGIYTVIYLVLFIVTGMLSFVPIFSFLFPIVTAILCGISFMLFLTKAKVFGMITIMGTLLGLIVFAMGQGVFAIITGVICGFIADLIHKAGEYKSWKHMIASFCVFSEWVIGSMLPMWIMKDSFFESTREMQGDAFVDALEPMITVGGLALLIVLTVVGALVGAFIGKAVLKKHFVRAGIA